MSILVCYLVLWSSCFSDNLRCLTVSNSKFLNNFTVPLAAKWEEGTARVHVPYFVNKMRKWWDSGFASNLLYPFSTLGGPLSVAFPSPWTSIIFRHRNPCDCSHFICYSHPQALTSVLRILFLLVWNLSALCFSNILESKFSFVFLRESMHSLYLKVYFQYVYDLIKR